MSKTAKIMLIAVGALVGLAGAIAISFSIWMATHVPSAGFAPYVWLPAGFFAIICGVFLAFGAAHASAKAKN